LPKKPDRGKVLGKKRYRPDWFRGGRDKEKKQRKVRKEMKESLPLEKRGNEGRL